MTNTVKLHTFKKISERPVKQLIERIIMLRIVIPGFNTLNLMHLILDYNGTLAYDGQLIRDVKASLESLSRNLQIHILTADTFGKARVELKGVDCKLSILPIENQDIGKLNYVSQLGAGRSVCIGNGRNDRLMLKKAALGIAVVQGEGAATEAVMGADIIAPNIISALELLNNPLRLTATLRS